MKEGVGPNGLNEKELVNKRNQLEIEQASFEEYPINSVILNTKRVKTTITEDGVILLQTSVEEVTRSVNRLKLFYEERLAPAISYLFSLGAPLPKELHKAKHIYPLLFVVKKSDPKSLAELFKKIENTEIESVSSDKLAVYFGQSAIIIENKKTETRNLIFAKIYR